MEGTGLELEGCGRCQCTMEGSLTCFIGEIDYKSTLADFVFEISCCLALLTFAIISFRGRFVPELILLCSSVQG